MHHNRYVLLKLKRHTGISSTVWKLFLHHKLPSLLCVENGLCCGVVTSRGDNEQMRPVLWGVITNCLWIQVFTYGHRSCGAYVIVALAQCGARITRFLTSRYESTRRWNSRWVLLTTEYLHLWIKFQNDYSHCEILSKDLMINSVAKGRQINNYQHCLREGVFWC